MNDVKECIDHIKIETDVELLKHKRDNAHRAAGIAASENCLKKFNRLVSIENACTARIEELERLKG